MTERREIRDAAERPSDAPTRPHRRRVPTTDPEEIGKRLLFAVTGVVLGLLGLGWATVAVFVSSGGDGGQPWLSDEESTLNLAFAIPGAVAYGLAGAFALGVALAGSRSLARGLIWATVVGTGLFFAGWIAGAIV